MMMLTYSPSGARRARRARARIQRWQRWERKRLSAHREIATLVRRLFSGVKTIADVAGDDGTLAKMLRRKGYTVTTIDPAPHDYAHGTGKQCLHRAAPTAAGPGYWPEEFVATMAKEFDLIVGLSPCKGTREVVLAAEYAPVLIIPCCFKWGSITRHPPRLKCMKKVSKNGRVSYRTRRCKPSEVPDVKPTIRRVWKRMGIEWKELVMKDRGRVAMWTTGRSE